MGIRPSTAATVRLGTAAVKLTVLLPAIVSVLLVSAPSAFAQPAGQDADSVAQLLTALEQGGLSVQSGLVSTLDWAGLYCKGERDDAGYVNKAPYLMTQVPESAAHPTPVENFKLRPDEAVVLSSSGAWTKEP